MVNRSKRLDRNPVYSAKRAEIARDKLFNETVDEMVSYYKLNPKPYRRTDEDKKVDWLQIILTILRYLLAGFLGYMGGNAIF